MTMHREENSRERSGRRSPERSTGRRTGVSPVLAPAAALLLLVLGQAGSALARVPQRAPQPQTYNVWAAGSNNCTCVRELSQLKKELAEETQQRQDLKGALETYVSELYELRAMVRSLKNSTPTAEKYSSLANSKALPAISFSSKLSYNRELKPLDTVVFDTVITNNGEAYNADTGKFAAPLPGTYVFYATILSGYNTKVETALIINDKEVARMYSGAHDAHGSGSNAAIVNLRSGDSVWVRLLYQGGNHVHGYYSTFSGAILSQQDQE